MRFLHWSRSCWLWCFARCFVFYKVDDQRRLEGSAALKLVPVLCLSRLFGFIVVNLGLVCVKVFVEALFLLQDKRQREVPEKKSYLFDFSNYTVFKCDECISSSFLLQGFRQQSTSNRCMSSCSFLSDVGQHESMSRFMIRLVSKTSLSVGTDAHKTRRSNEKSYARGRSGSFHLFHGLDQFDL